MVSLKERRLADERLGKASRRGGKEGSRGVLRMGSKRIKREKRNGKKGRRERIKEYSFFRGGEKTPSCDLLCGDGLEKETGNVG